MQFLRTKILIFKNLLSHAIDHFKYGSSIGDLPMIKPKKSTEYSNIIRRLLLLIFTAQWIWLIFVSERMYIKNGDIGDNWTKLMVAVIGLLTVVCGFYFSGQYSDRNSEEFKKIKQYDNARLDEYREEIKEGLKEEIKEELVEEYTPKATLEEDEEDDA